MVTAGGRAVEVGRGGCRSLLYAEGRRLLPDPQPLEVHPGLPQAEGGRAAGADEIGLQVALDGPEFLIAHGTAELDPRLPQVEGEQVVVAVGGERGVDVDGVERVAALEAVVVQGGIEADRGTDVGLEVGLAGDAVRALPFDDLRRDGTDGPGGDGGEQQDDEPGPRGSDAR